MAIRRSRKVALASELSQPIAGYKAWHDMSDTSSYTLVGNNISQWNDKSANAYHLTQGTDANRPTTGNSRKINGILVAEFDGTDDVLTSSMPQDDMTSTQFIVALVDGFANYRSLMESSAGSGNTFRNQITGGALTTAKEGVIEILINPVVTVGVAFAACQKLSATFMEHWLDRETIAGTAHSQSFTAGATLRVGLNRSGLYPHDGLIAEIISYPTTLSFDNIAATMKYLRNKWGTP